MDADLKVYLEGMESRIVERVTERVGARLDAMEERLKEVIAAGGKNPPGGR